MSVLDKIVALKQVEVAAQKDMVSVAELERSTYFSAPAVSLAASVCDRSKSGIITEFKRRSPSRGDIHPGASAKDITQGYAAAGSSGLSVLTETHYFGGSTADLLEARVWNTLPILRKDFIVDPYQVVEAKSIGADAVLLIAACLKKSQLRDLAELARSLGMEVLMEVHEASELDHWNPYVNLVGVNNRNLKTLEVSVQTSFDLYDVMPKDAVLISESGIDDPAVVVALKQLGYHGFLMGEYFMKQPVPQQACKEFVEEVARLDDFLKNAIA